MIVWLIFLIYGELTIDRLGPLSGGTDRIFRRAWWKRSAFVMGLYRSRRLESPNHDSALLPR